MTTGTSLGILRIPKILSISFATVICQPLLVGTVSGAWFEEVTSAAGVSYTGPSFGASWGDVNGDGWADLWVGNHAANPRDLFVNNRDGTFTPIPSQYTWSRDAHGSAWADFDNDGDQDLLTLVGGGSVAGNGPNELFINSGGLLEERAQQYGLDYTDGRGRTPLWLDWDNNGELDVFFSNWVRPDGALSSALFSQVKGVFTDSFGQTGLQTSTNNSYAQMMVLGSGSTPALVVHGERFPDRVYDYSVTPFIDLNAAASLFPASLWSVKDSVIIDFNGDQQLDVFLAQALDQSEVVQLDPNSVIARIQLVTSEKGFSFSGVANIQIQVEPPSKITASDIYIGSQGINPPGRTFSLSSADPSTSGMPPHVPGVDNGVYIGYEPSLDQWTILVSNDSNIGLNFMVTSGDAISGLTPIGFQNSDGGLPDKLFVQAAGVFSDVSAISGINISTPCESATGGDFDNDMDLDLYLVCRGPATNRTNILYENLGNGTFRSVPGAGGAQGSSVGRGESVATADYDNDGFIDLFITNGGGVTPFNVGPSQLFHNVGNGNHWIEIDLEGVVSNRDGIGARILTSAGGVIQLRHQDGGMHRFSQNHQRIHFGLAGHTLVDTLTVEWPSGIVQTIENLPADEIVHVLEPSYPALLGQPGYVSGQNVGVYLWKDSFDGPYHLEVNGDGPLSIFAVELLADQPLASVTPRLLEVNDSLAWDTNHLRFEGRVTSGLDGLDFRLAPGSRALLAVARNGVSNPRQLHIGASGDPLTPAGWVLAADTLPALPAFQGGVDLGLFAGRANGQVRARWNGDGPRHYAELELLFSQTPLAVTPVGFEANDTLATTAYAVAAAGVVTVGWDGLNLDLPAGTRMGLVYTQDGLIQPHRVNPASRNLGLPNAYHLPQATPYGVPAYDPATEAGLFLWQDEATGLWHVQGTAGRGFARYTGELVSDQPFASVTARGLEASDTLDNTTDPNRIVFDLSLWSPWEDGFEFQVPDGANVQLSLQSVPGTSPVEAIRIGAQRWPVEQLPVDISGW